MSQGLRARLEASLNSLLGIPCSRCLATNSISLGFGSEADPQDERYLWIEPPWRLLAGGRFLVGSQDCPIYDESDGEREYTESYDEWAAPFMGWGKVSVKDFRLGHPVPDLALEFSSGHLLETFNRSREEYSWYYREDASGVVIRAYASGIVDDSG